MSIISEFKEFANRGNVVDMAVGIIIGGAFGKIVNSLVADIIMPPIGYLIGGVKFSDLKITLKAPTLSLDGIKEMEAVTINYGSTIQVVFEFLIVAWAVFLLVKGLNAMRKKQEAAPVPEAPPAPPADIQLLTEIRDLLKK